MTMRAVGYRENLDVGDPASLVDVTMPVPVPGPHDLLVRVRAASVNPIEPDPPWQPRRRRRCADPRLRRSRHRRGDRSGGHALRRRRRRLLRRRHQPPGSNAEFQVVDEHIVGRKPATLDFAQSAALPLTTITAWEGLFDRLGLTPDSSGTLVAVAAAGGVGSMVTQLARTQTGLTVIATASRPDPHPKTTKIPTTAENEASRGRCRR